MIDSNENIVYVFLYIILFFSAIFVGFTIFIFKSRKKILEKEFEKKDIENKFQQESLRLILNTQEEERKRIAQDLHDEISSKINIVFFQSNMLLGGKVKQEDINYITQNIVDTSKSIQENARAIAYNLLPPVLQKFGLHQAIIELIKEQNNNLLTLKYNNPFEEAFFETISTENHIHFYRIIQELITNSIIHGKATEITITMEQNQCIYTDNGNGISEKRIGLGTVNILNRVKIINATFDIKNKENGVIANLKFL